MSWQCPRIDQGSYGSDPFMQSPGGHARGAMEMQQSIEQQHFLSSATTREQEELLRRKAEHMESLDIAPQHRYPAYNGRSSRSRFGRNQVLFCRLCQSLFNEGFLISGSQTKLYGNTSTFRFLMLQKSLGCAPLLSRNFVANRASCSGLKGL
jgi:hypothetical protein